LLAPFASACGPSGEELISETKSPDGARVVSVYVRNCGATTDYVTHANVRRASRSFQADWHGTVKTGEALTLKGNVVLHPVWTTANSLRFPVDRLDVLECRASVEGVHVSCSMNR
jgi:hypothetical protein